MVFMVTQTCITQVPRHLTIKQLSQLCIPIKPKTRETCLLEKEISSWSSMTQTPTGGWQRIWLQMQKDTFLGIMSWLKSWKRKSEFYLLHLYVTIELNVKNCRLHTSCLSFILLLFWFWCFFRYFFLYLYLSWLLIFLFLPLERPVIIGVVYSSSRSNMTCMRG